MKEGEGRANPGEPKWEGKACRHWGKHAHSEIRTKEG